VGNVDWAKGKKGTTGGKPTLRKQNVGDLPVWRAAFVFMAQTFFCFRSCLEEGGRTHNGCARFCGDEWRSDWRISIRPRALLQGRDLLEQKAIADARTIDWQKQGECLNPKVVFLLWRRQTGDRAALVVRVGYAF